MIGYLERKNLNGEWKPGKIAWVQHLPFAPRARHGPNGSRVIMERIAVEVMQDLDGSHVVLELANVRPKGEFNG